MLVASKCYNGFFLYYCLQAAFDHAVKNDLKVKVTCTYLQKYLEDHPLSEYTSRIIEQTDVLHFKVLLVVYLDYYALDLAFMRKIYEHISKENIGCTTSDKSGKEHNFNFSNVKTTYTDCNIELSNRLSQNGCGLCMTIFLLDFVSHLFFC